MENTYHGGYYSRNRQYNTGMTIWIVLTLEGITPETGNTICIVVSMVDITPETGNTIHYIGMTIWIVLT